MSCFYKITNKRQLAEIIGCPYKNLIDFRSDSNYYIFPNKGKLVTAPYDNLKEIQRKFKNILVNIKTPGWLQSGKKGMSYLKNAEIHIDGNYLLNMDICKFYESSSKEFVYRFFKYDLNQSDDVAWFCTDLLTYDGFIPRGSPSSQILSFWAFRKIFERIYELVISRNVQKMSLYVDDFTCSSDVPIRKDIPYLINLELKKVGHQLKEGKNKFFKKNQFKKVTGVMLSKDREMRIPNKRRYEIINELKYFRNNTPFDKKMKQSLKGKINSARQIEYNFLRKIYL